MNQTYDVALWHYWPTTALPYTDDVEAESPLLAVLSLMQAHNLKHVAYAAVRLPDRTFQRYQTGVSLYAPSSEGERVYTLSEALPDERRS